MSMFDKMKDQAQDVVEENADTVKTQVETQISNAMSGLGVGGEGQAGAGGGMTSQVTEQVNEGIDAGMRAVGIQPKAGGGCAAHGGAHAPHGKAKPHGKHPGKGPGHRACNVPDNEFKTEVEGAIKADVRMFSGCQDEQTSADVHDVAKFGLPDATGAGGACTNAILVNLKDNKPDSWISLLKGMRGTLKAKKFKQVPQLATSRELDITQPFALSGGDGGNHRALLIGINYKGMGAGELKGCHNDVESMKGFIPEYGYPTEEGPNLKIITDDGTHEDPTRENIVKSMKWLINGAKPGDSLFMHYSGHGGSVRDNSGDEEDAKDETMVPLDYAKKGQIKDDEILETLVMPLDAGVTLTVVMDCCHSGSILDLPYAFNANDNELQAVESGGGPRKTHKKGNFNMKKMKRARKGKKP